MSDNKDGANGKALEMRDKKTAADSQAHYRVNVVSDEVAHEARIETFKNSAKLEQDGINSASKQNWYTQLPQQQAEAGHYNGSMFNNNLNGNVNNTPKK
ncbi:hypothetical protein [Cysteiniphilum sp. QT6929]|uniref:hypothetical protein n=1 Tax=Cysteiniphilum sp. QT6929 TaxID=2975055 RepID=UPI0024B37AE1|nr:hypothetical protein [Cysteiniphilum sp. QT6929]WHN64852.1 hypothetical protein NYP54_07290 [Cysteiniphilum sp. QT6929]